MQRMLLLIVLTGSLLMHRATADLVFEAVVNEQVVECKLQRNSTQLLSGSLFGLAQHPQQMGWFPARFDVPDGDVLGLSITRLGMQSYSGRIIGGTAVDPVSRQLAVATPEGALHLWSMAMGELEAAIQSDVGLLQFDWATGLLYGTAWQRISSMSSSDEDEDDEGRGRHLQANGEQKRDEGKRAEPFLPNTRSSALRIVHVDFASQTTKLVAETDACAVVNALRALDYIQGKYYFLGVACGDTNSKLYEVNINTGEVVKLSSPSGSIIAMAFAPSSSGAGILYAWSHATPGSSDFSLATLNTTTGHLHKVGGDKAYRANSAIFGAANTFDMPNGAFLIQSNVDPNALDVVDVSSGLLVQRLPVTRVDAGNGKITSSTKSASYGMLGAISFTPVCKCCTKEATDIPVMAQNVSGKENQGRLLRSMDSLQIQTCAADDPVKRDSPSTSQSGDCWRYAVVLLVLFFCNAFQ